MCGICGAVQLKGGDERGVAPEVLDRMVDVMTHRGPDDRGVYAAPGVALGMRRLSIVDVEGGHQPVANEDGTVWAIQNGELFNHTNIRRDLSRLRHELRTRSDTEVIPHLYEEHGSSFASSLNGMFAIAVWDESRRRLVLARDRLGVKPLYFASGDGVLVFGSELKSVLASGLVDRELDLEAIDCYLRLGFFPAPTTPLSSVSKLPPGCTLVVTEGAEPRIERWWAYPAPQPVLGRTLAENAAMVLELAEEAVRAQLMSDVPIGAMLSGGLDSSLLAALMARGTTRVKTFSVGFDGDIQSELADARLVARSIGADHQELELPMAETGIDLDDVVWHLDEPLADLSSIGFQALSALASRHVTVALCGQGPDELYGGYDKHRAAALIDRLDWMPEGIRRVTCRGLGRLGGGLGRLARSIGAPTATERVLAMSGLLDDTARIRLVRGALAQRDGLAARRLLARIAPPDSADALAETLYIDGQLALVDDMLHFTDRTSMAKSLEVRVPFLDHRIVEHSATIPSDQKVRGSATKLVLKHAARGIVPDEIIDKPKVGFFATSTDVWLSTQLDGQLRERLGDPSAPVFDLLNHGEVTRLVARHKHGSGKQASRLLLAILMLEVWLSTYLPRSFSAPHVAVRP